jgi:RNA polymerase sigma factor (sigma-70 family)
VDWVKARVSLDHFEVALKNSCDGEDNLWAAIRDGRQAEDQLFRRYTPVALHLARARRGHGLPLEDLLAAALEGLRKAILGFRSERGTKFSTYATETIRHEICTAFRNAPGLRSHLTRRAAAFEDKRQTLAAEFGRPPSDAEIYRALEWSKLQIENFAKGKLLLETKSIDAELAERGDTVPENREGGPLVILINREENSRLYAALGQLDPIAQFVLRSRFLEDVLLSQDAVAAKLGVTRDRVREIEKASFASLRLVLETTETTDRCGVKMNQLQSEPSQRKGEG